MKDDSGYSTYHNNPRSAKNVALTILRRARIALSTVARYNPQLFSSRLSERPPHGTHLSGHGQGPAKRQSRLAREQQDAADLEAETMKIATQLAASAPLALRATLDVVNIGGECGIEEGLQYESAQFGLMFATDDMREGTRAFVERRKPVFTGH